MEAKQRQILELFGNQNTQFSIPVYQRDYNWEEKQCKTLLKDIENIHKNQSLTSHFIGSIVYLHEGVYCTGKKEFSIIDGQQRLTTITLLLIALYHRLDEFNDENKRDMIYKRYLIDEYMESKDKLKLMLPGNNFNILKKIMHKEIEFLNTIEKESNIYKNYNLFYNNIDTIDKAYNLIQGINSLIYVDIALENGKDDPQRIFESLNSTGLDLSQADLIRNFILMDLDKETQNRIYEDYWILMEDNCKTIEKNKYVTKLSDFIRDFLTFKFGKIPVKSKVFEEFKTRYENKSKIELEQEINIIEKYSRLYGNILNPSKEQNKSIYEKMIELAENEDLQEIHKEQNKNISKHLRYLKILDYKVINPFLIGIYMDYKENVISEKVFIDILELLQSYLLRRYICKEKTNELNSTFMNLYYKIDKNNYYNSIEIYLINQKFPNDKDLKENLKINPIYKEAPEKLMYIFERIENENHNEKIDFNSTNITLEHIFPQKPNNKWKDALISVEYEKMETLKHTIANITLTGSNSNLGNRSFIEKRDLKEFGYKDSKFLLNKWISEQNEWNTSKLDERLDIIFEYIINIWKKPYAEEDIINIDDIIFYCKGKRGNARGIKLDKNNKFKVFKDSKASKELFNRAEKENPKIVSDLLEQKVIIEESETYLFVKDYVFNSPSEASRFILGTSSNGWIDWKTSEGKPLNEFKDK